MHAQRKETKLNALVYNSVDKLENSELITFIWVIINVQITKYTCT